MNSTCKKIGHDLEPMNGSGDQICNRCGDFVFSWESDNSDTSFCAGDIRAWLANNLPYFECSESDEVFFILTPADIESVSHKLFELLKQGQL